MLTKKASEHYCWKFGKFKGFFIFYVITAFHLLSCATIKKTMNKHVYYHKVIKKKFVVWRKKPHSEYLNASTMSHIQVYLLLDKYPEAFLPIGSQVEIYYLDKIPSFIFIWIFLFHFIRGTLIIRKKDWSIFEVISWELYSGS